MLASDDRAGCPTKSDGRSIPALSWPRRTAVAPWMVKRRMPDAEILAYRPVESIGSRAVVKPVDDLPYLHFNRRNPFRLHRTFPNGPSIKNEGRSAAPPHSRMRVRAAPGSVFRRLPRLFSVAGVVHATAAGDAACAVPADPSAPGHAD